MNKNPIKIRINLINPIYFQKKLKIKRSISKVKVKIITIFQMIKPIKPIIMKVLKASKL